MLNKWCISVSEMSTVYLAPAAGLPVYSAQLLPTVRVQPDAACLSNPELGNDRPSIEMDSQKTQICRFSRTPRPLSNFQLNLFTPRSHNFPHQFPSAVGSDRPVSGWPVKSEAGNIWEDFLQGLSENKLLSSRDT